MRFVSFSKDGREAVGVVLGGDLVDLQVAEPRLPGTLLGLIRAGALAEAEDAAKRAPASALVDPENVRWLPVVTRPPKIFGLGRNYGSHVVGRPVVPGFFISTATRLTGHKEPILLPTHRATLDYEVELAVVIGKAGKNIPIRQALDHVAGYTILNDASIREYFVGEGLALMKNCDRTAPLGPVMVTPDELPLGGDGLRLKTRRNGVEVQNDSTDTMFWKIAEMLEMTSKYLTLDPGDVITTGTPGGTVVDRAIMAGRSPRDAVSDLSLDWLRDGETIECEIEGIGVISNPIVAEGKWNQ